LLSASERMIQTHQSRKETIRTSFGKTITLFIRNRRILLQSIDNTMQLHINIRNAVSAIELPLKVQLRD
jgi:hypothetical protein